MKSKEEIKKYNKEYRKKNKDKIKEKKKEYYEKNKKKIIEKDKEKKERLYNQAIERLCNYYKIEKPYCFFCKKEYSMNHDNNKNFIVIDHKNEKISGKKDKLHGNSLYKYLCKCEESELKNYQFLCSIDNLMKESTYKTIQELKDKGDDEDYEELLDIYKHTLIINNPKQNTSTSSSTK